MKNAVIFMLSIGLSIVVGIVVGTNKAEDRLVEYDKKYEKIEKDVSTFVDVSNPKTIRMYTKELRDILDNMSRLSKIIDKGEEIDIALGKIMDGIEQLEDQWDVTLSNDLKMKETIEVVNNHIKEVDSMAICYMVIEVKDNKQLQKLKNVIVKAVQPQSIERI